MEMKKWSDYGRYIVIADNAKDNIRIDYTGYLEFQKVTEVLKIIAGHDKSTFFYEKEFYKRPIERLAAQSALDDIYRCRYNSAIKKIANFMKFDL
jgi:hypothetical protein